MAARQDTDGNAEESKAVAVDASRWGRGFALRALLGVALAVAGASLGGAGNKWWLEAVGKKGNVESGTMQMNERREEQDEYEVMLEGERNEPQGAEDEKITVKFVNRWGGATSLFWIDPEDEWHLTSASFNDELTIDTFHGHQFVFTAEGTKDQIGEVVTIDHKQRTYTLPAGSRRLSESDDDKCRDRTKRCQTYHKQGECTKNPGWMIVNCPKSCNSCQLLDPEKRCDRAFLNISAEHVWKPGDLNRMFERIVREMHEYNPRVLSQPPEGPWILEFPGFLNDEEIDTLLGWGDRLGYARSTDTGVQNAFGETTKIVSQSRTSSNTWCTRDCENDPVVQGISKKTEILTGVPIPNYESIQLLEYSTGQYYRTHHDMSERDRVNPSGPRILTFFLYLSDVDEGGETHFPRVGPGDGLKVKPSRGSAILWPSVLDEHPLKQDPRTHHAALPVIRGLKYAANHWLHSHNFAVANLWGCTGSFD